MPGTPIFGIGKITRSLPYATKLEQLPAYLQQLQMESLGKSITEAGKPCPYLVSPIIFGEIGTRSQHALTQYFTQANGFVPIDYIGVKQTRNDSEKRLNTHLKAQSNTLALGDKDAAHSASVINGNKPHTLISLDDLTSVTLGALLALYEHKVFTLSVLYQVNPFDQWGVERGKILASEIYKEMETELMESTC